jgi:hypothetical protein
MTAFAGPLHAFLAGSGTDGRGRTVDAVLAFDDGALERHHDYIQWLFPLDTPSMAQPGSPVLSAAEAAAIRADPRAVATLRRAAAVMLGFYARQRHWLTHGDHNHLRITRIVKSLDSLVGHEDAKAFLTAILAHNAAAGAPVNPTSLRYWREALGSVAGPA